MVRRSKQREEEGNSQIEHYEVPQASRDVVLHTTTQRPTPNPTGSSRALSPKDQHVPSWFSQTEQMYNDLPSSRLPKDTEEYFQWLRDEFRNWLKMQFPDCEIQVRSSSTEGGREAVADIKFSHGRAFQINSADFATDPEALKDLSIQAERKIEQYRKRTRRDLGHT